MNKKTVSISLPQIEGVELKNATVDLEKVLWLRNMGGGFVSYSKKGDFLTCLSDPSKTVIFNAIAPSIGKMKAFTILYDLPMQFNGKMAYTLTGTKFPFSNFRYSTEEEKALMIEEMEKLGKGIIQKPLGIEDIGKDISEIAVDFGSAVDYLLEDLHDFKFLATKNHSSKLLALNYLITLAEAWNTFDGFKPDWENRLQKKYYPAFEPIEGKVEFWNVSYVQLISDTHTSNFSFRTPERAELFGRQFIDLFRIVLSN